MGRHQILAMCTVGLILCIISFAYGGEAQIPTTSSLPWGLGNQCCLYLLLS